eukprot:CAMPEP_0195041644 /NCGR_PEP_ID=MMETSP0347-20130606/1032_1 /TAXON_ID=2932 /ORGANISM="Alexandrium fundyense, Strain CCMP1719" /LENGTH=82 /DNA_ID=CAMNT_0040068727 /DNA_START=5 /DNA_END=250 /DNA_ORIENTATION=-
MTPSGSSSTTTSQQLPSNAQAADSSSLAVCISKHCRIAAWEPFSTMCATMVQTMPTMTCPTSINFGCMNTFPPCIQIELPAT